MASSRRWPAMGRLTIYGGLLLMVLVNLHARGALQDTSALTSISYDMFRGIVDIGIPFALYVYAGRHWQKLPVKTHQMIGAFCAGAAGVLLLNALDKLAAASRSLTALRTDLQMRARMLLAGDLSTLLTLVPAPRAGWIAIRGVLVVALLCSIAWGALRFARRGSLPSGAVVILMAAAATGMSSFSQMLVDLPFVPPAVQLLISPYTCSIEIDENLIALFLTYSLPAIALALIVTRPGARRAGSWMLAVPAAALLHLCAVFIWPAKEPWLRASGIDATLGAAGLLALVLLIRAARQRLAEAPRANSRAVTAFACAGFLALAAIAWRQTLPARLESHALPGFETALRIPSTWKPLEKPPAGTL